MSEKSIFRHIWTILLTLVLCLPVQAEAAELVESGTVDTITWAFYDDGTLELTAPTESETHNYLLDGHGAAWAAYYNDIVTLHIGEGVDGIGFEFFKGYPFSTVVMSDDVVWLDDAVFADCYNLTSVTLSASLKKLPDYTFYGSGLTSFTVPATVTDLGMRVFESCSGLTSVVFEEPSQEQVDSGSYLNGISEFTFMDCTSLSSVTLSSRISSIQAYAFYNTSSLKSITLRSPYISHNVFEKSGLKEIYFSDCPPSFSENAFEHIIATVYYNPAFPGWDEELETLMQTEGCELLQWVPAILPPNNVCGEEAYWDFDFDSGELIISGTGSTYNFTSNEYPAQAPWVSLSEQIRSVTIEDGITGLGSFLLEEAAPETITFLGDMPTIHEDAFYGVTATAYYPADRNWIPDQLQDYGVTWQSVCTGVDHEFAEEGTVETKPTCNSEGKMLYPCVNCEAGSREEPIPVDPEAHSYIRTIGKAATCTTEGYYRHICRNCSDHYVGETIPLQPHTRETIRAVQATCTSTGYSGDVICSVCKADLETGKPVPMLDHTPTRINEIRPTCTSTGYSGDVVCSACQHTIENGSLLPADSHDWNGWVTVLSPSYTHTGLQRRTCDTCGKAEEQSLAKLSQDNPFSDLVAKAYYYDAVLWAYRQGITTGKTETTFAPGDDCLRAEVVTFLWRSMGKPANKNAKNPFADVADAKYYYDAVLWASKNNITVGTDPTHFSPNLACTRAHVVTFLWRVSGSPEVEGSNPFADVKTGSYYYDAVLWAAQSGITTGTDATHFSPNSTCTRGQIATFLYRCFASSESQNSGNSQKQVLSAAKEYLDLLPFSYLSLIEQLEYDGWSHTDAVYAADHCKADWMEQALRHANNYLDAEIGFSHQSLTEQLEYEQYTQEQVAYAMENITADWNAQALIKANAYLEYDPSFTRQELIDQMEYEGFTAEQAEYAADQLKL